MTDPVLSRRVALAILAACLDKGQPLDDALARHPGFPGLDPRDRAFVRLLLATTLRRLGEIDEVLAFLVERPLEGANAAGWQVLRLGAAQLLFLGTPPHAAVDTSVRLVVDSGLPHIKGLVNAVLRRISRDGVALLGDRDLGRSGVPVQFFGAKAKMPAGPAALAVDTGAVLITAQLYLEDGRNWVRFQSPVDVPQEGERSRRIFRTTQLVADKFEEGIGARPADWHMMQRLWVDDLDPAKAPKE